MHTLIYPITRILGKFRKWKMSKIWLPECGNFLVLQKLTELGHPLLERDHGSFPSSSHLQEKQQLF
jgi:hypothetical protein